MQLVSSVKRDMKSQAALVLVRKGEAVPCRIHVTKLIRELDASKIWEYP